MSVEQLKAALARKKSSRGQDTTIKDSADSNTRGASSQVANKQPPKRSAGRGR